jgi:hypothetical protein
MLVNSKILSELRVVNSKAIFFQIDWFRRAPLLFGCFVGSSYLHQEALQ